MKAYYFRKGWLMAMSLILVFCALVFVWGLISLSERKSYYTGLDYFVMGLISVSTLFLLWITWIFVRSLVYCVFRHHPALVLTDKTFRVYNIVWGDYLVFSWQDIAAFLPYTYKGKTTYYIVVKDRQAYIQQVPNRLRRLLLRTNTLLVSDSITNIAISSIDTNETALLEELNRHIS